MAKGNNTFTLRRAHDWQSADRLFDKSTGRFYELDDNGQLVPVKNALTDPDYKPIDYSSMDGAGLDLTNYGDYA